MTDDTPGPLDLMLTRHLKARRETLWRCWTEPRLLEQWFCPRPWRATDVVIDLRPGGAFATTIRGPQGEVHAGDPGCWLEVTPQTRLAWTSALGPGWRPLIPPADGFAMTAALTFRDAEGGGTIYTARVLHADATGRDRHAAMGFHEGWGAATAQLDDLALTL